VGPGAAQGAGQKVQGVLFCLGVAAVVPQQPVGGYDIIHVVRAFLAAFNFPCADLRYRQQYLDEDIQAQILAGEKPPSFTLLDVNPAAGLNATSPQAAFAAQKLLQ